MIQDLMELRHASWVARRAEAKPMTIDEIHEEERLKRQQQERDQERDRQQRRDPNRPMVIGTAYSGGNQQQQYNDGRGSRGSGMKTQNNRNDDDRVENRFNVNSLRQLQSNDKRGQGPMVSRSPSTSSAKHFSLGDESRSTTHLDQRIGHREESRRRSFVRQSVRKSPDLFPLTPFSPVGVESLLPVLFNS